MKLRPVFASWIATVLLLGAAAAQSDRPILTTANIPFDFVAGGVHLTAGTYNLYHIFNSNTVLVQRTDLKAEAIVPLANVSEAVRGKASTKLVFNRYGDQTFLAQVWTGRDQQIHQCAKCPAEKALMSQPQKATTLTITEQ